MVVQEEFCVQWGETRQLMLGVPCQVSVSSDGNRVTFLRSANSRVAHQSLWVLDRNSDSERLVADVAALARTCWRDALQMEKDRRERVREFGEGIVQYDVARDGLSVVFALGGWLYRASVDTGECRRVECDHDVYDPHVSSSGEWVVYSDGKRSYLKSLETGVEAAVADVVPPEVRWGVADFVAAEEMGRSVAMWWAGDDSHALVARVCTDGVTKCVIADLEDPTHECRVVPYPLAGTKNSEVELWAASVDGNRQRLEWDQDKFEYLVSVSWSSGTWLLGVESRDQKTFAVYRCSVTTGRGDMVAAWSDVAWCTIIEGVPALLGGGEPVIVCDDSGSRRLVVGGVPVTPAGLEVRRVIGIDGGDVWFEASEEPTSIDVYRWSKPGELTCMSVKGGVTSGSVGGGTVALTRASLESDWPETVVHWHDGTSSVLESRAEAGLVRPKVSIVPLGTRGLRSVLLRPEGWDRSRGERLPVILDPYGGPSSQRVLRSRNNFMVSQWFANQGFAVLVVDGRGTRGRGSLWERLILGDTASGPLDDQVEALMLAGASNPELDLTRVGIRGWSYGGFMAALAVLKYPEIFHAAVAGAPDADARLYDTHFKERYLGDPKVSPDTYDRSSLVGSGLGPTLRRPLMIIHGMADDNVLVGHSLRLMSEIASGGRSCSVVLLPGVTHMVVDPVMARRRLVVESVFFHDHLASRC